MAINRTALKNYAPQARLDFIQAMMNRAAQLGITETGVSKGEQQGELFIVQGKSFPSAVGVQRAKLIERINLTSFGRVMEAVAYTWFNRFLAIRYMELHGFFDHGYRVLSHPQGHAEPEILSEAVHLDLPGLKRDMVVELKLRGTQDEALYRKILIAQCNDLYRAMPFLFEKIEDETELLLPENLLQSDSIIRKLVGAIDEAEWNNIEIIGWLYQFYISDKKDQVIGKVVKSEDIPAATQLFTPNWIVKYMVQNSLGATWLGTYPESAIRGMMDYYIEPVEQKPEVNEQLAEIAPKSLDPESLTLIDPAVGSGHILVEAYDLFKAIYVERGYTPKESARLILTKNLYGLDVDDRAAQMAGFAILMKARADDRSLLRDPPKLNVLALQESNGLNADEIVATLLPKEQIELIPSDDLLPETLVQPTLALSTGSRAGNEVALTIRELLEVFKDAKTYGSLITVGSRLSANLQQVENALQQSEPTDFFRRAEFQHAVEGLQPLVDQTKILGKTYNCVVANPPYMGSNAMNILLKEYCKLNFRSAKSDLMTCFMFRVADLTSKSGYWSMINLPSWMFLGTYSEFRSNILAKYNISSLIHLGRGVFGSDFGTVAFAVRNNRSIVGEINTYRKLFEQHVSVRSSEEIRRLFLDRSEGVYFVDQNSFNNIPNSPLSYNLGARTLSVYQEYPRVSTIGQTGSGLQTSDNERFLRQWHEVSARDIMLSEHSRAENRKWVPHKKGGPYRKWYGNNDYVLNWKNDGQELYAFAKALYGSPSRIIKNTDKYFKEGITWSHTTSSYFSARLLEKISIFNVESPAIFSEHSDIIFAYLGSNVGRKLIEIANPTLHFVSNSVGDLPIAFNQLLPRRERLQEIVSGCVAISKSDWDDYEASWNFVKSPLLKYSRGQHLEGAFEEYLRSQTASVKAITDLEAENNEIMIQAFRLEGEFFPSVTRSEITLTGNPFHRYGVDLPDSEIELRQKSDTMRELISYAVGCMMGRYSLAEPGLIYGHAGNKDFDATRYGSFPADPDGIIAVTEDRWFEDDAANRFEEFLSVAWPASSVSDNLAFLIDCLNKGRSDDPRADLRGYLAKKFYTDHLQTYKNRPIYWLFSSGKQKAFECLVYLHRYHEGTLARMRTEYVTPLTGKMLARIEALENEITQSSSSAEKNRKTKDVTKLRKQLEELRAFDEELRHLADQRIALDLDDGVKVNYGKFGNLLAAKDKVCGKRDDTD
ncbi:BREX-1 system adenine-specific DNA-methyltransferase PglX [Rhizobium leguminosarum]|uniref:BREX-1 system adenine-specific DNA-methyltransferase PglX n=1 Tax=Rhizobium leguminosarum TaxID=384 RepID=UPI00102F7955|nr:BREX-1 system adenine-specific DNA-methyltransferase PglX [Rhizobium leguminosarum]TBG20527.1 BREX-1 system adenine-specific DNA-methyltransferase PglX [Rhizobium leguminosarum]TBG46443.1 BREX-1 system adenine-specific DNA-methyltransferase PglX [Rhizobium leguminosarum]TBG79414.1 BREX-1 system adenine-specific DNA-methyltransferase PglX [Rhizobium leguminosarum]